MLTWYQIDNYRPPQGCVSVLSRGSETIQQTKLWEIFADSEVNVRNFGNIWKPGSSCLRHRLAAKVLGRHLRLTFPHLFNRPAKNKNGVNRRDLYPFFFLKMLFFYTSLNLNIIITELTIGLILTLVSVSWLNILADKSFGWEQNWRLRLALADRSLREMMAGRDGWDEKQSTWRLIRYDIQSLLSICTLRTRARPGPTSTKGEAARWEKEKEEKLIEV